MLVSEWSRLLSLCDGVTEAKRLLAACKHVSSGIYVRMCD